MMPLPITPIQSILEHSDWNRIRWGVIHDPAAVLLQDLPKLTVDKDDWWQIDAYDHLVGAPDLQTVGSCTCDTETRRARWHIHRTHGLHVQFDVERFYWFMRERLYGNHDDGGGTNASAFDAAVLAGIYPAGTRRAPVARTPRALCEAIQRGPIATSQALHNGWKPSNLNRDNGAVDESYIRDVNPLAGHAMLAPCTQIHNGVCTLVQEQSWGPLGYKGAGIVMQTVGHYLKTALADPVELFLNENDWQAWRGWEEWVKA